jgi:hypothetical protein
MESCILVVAQEQTFETEFSNGTYLKMKQSGTQSELGK